jgi:cysteine synthase A
LTRTHTFHDCPSLNTALCAIHRNFGDTPFVRIEDDGWGGGIYAKCEWSNAFGTVKDRAAFWMLVDALQRYSSWQDARENLHVLEYSGGSLACALARMCEALGVRCTMVVGGWLSPLELEGLRGTGASVVITPKERGFLAVMIEAQRLSREDRNFTFLNQHENPACIRAHEVGTGPEVVRQLHGILPHAWVSSIGTGATLVGVAKALRQVNPYLGIHAVTPAEQPYGTSAPPNGLRKIAGSGGLGNGLRQRFLEDFLLPVRHWDIAYEEAARAMRALESESGIRVGSSSAANLIVARKIHGSLGKGHVVVTVFPSAGTEAEWTHVNGLASESESTIQTRTVS